MSFTFFTPSIRMSGKNVSFGDKKIKGSKFYKNKKVTKIDDIKEEPYVQKIHLLDTMIMLLDHYA